MAELARARPIVQAETLLTYYGFDLSGYTVHRTIQDWLHDYRADWIPAAIVEALYQGRYKSVSVSQILLLWKRRGQPLRHFNHEFETIICRELPYPPELTSLLLPPAKAVSSLQASPSLDKLAQPQVIKTNQALESTLPTADAANTDDNTAPALLDGPSVLFTVDNKERLSASQGITEGGYESPSDRTVHGESDRVEPTDIGSDHPDQRSDLDASDNRVVDLFANKRDRTQSQPLPEFAAAANDDPPTETHPTADQQTPEAIPPFQPTPLNRRAELRVLQVSSNSKSGVTPPDSIHQFIPEASLSNTHAKLKAVAQPDSHPPEH